MTEHTPTPWRFEPDTKTIRSVPANYWLATLDSWDGAIDNNANAAFMIRAVNAHAELVAALQTALPRVEELARGLKARGYLHGVSEVESELRGIRAALAKAGGGPLT